MPTVDVSDEKKLAVGAPDKFHVHKLVWNKHEPHGDSIQRVMTTDLDSISHGLLAETLATHCYGSRILARGGGKAIGHDRMRQDGVSAVWSSHLADILSPLL